MVAQVYSLGDGMRRCVPAELQEGQIIFLNGYGQNERYHDRKAIYAEEEHNFGKVYLWVNLDKPERGRDEAFHIRPIEEIFGIGTYYKKGDFASRDEIDTALVKAVEAEKKMLEASELKKKENERLFEVGRKLFERAMPADAVGVIIAEKMVDDSDIQTDYFASHAGETVILAFTKKTREDFKEMRKAADKFKPTQHLGTGKGVFRPIVVIGEDFKSNGSYYHKGSRSHWHAELTRDEKGNDVEFMTRQEAEQYTMKQLPGSISFDDVVIPFSWEIQEEKVEHRENYSMGSGYYLGLSKYCGWTVRKSCWSKYGKPEDYYIIAAKQHERKAGE